MICLGAIAQLGERLHGMQEVVGSSPTSSIRRHPREVVADLRRPSRAFLSPRTRRLPEWLLGADPVTDWREEERARQSLASQLHESASRDLVASPRLYGSVPTDGPVDDMLTARTRSPRTVRPNLPRGWSTRRNCLLGRDEPALRRSTPMEKIVAHGCRPQTGCDCADLVPLDLAALSSDLARLRRAATALEPLDDAELVRVAGRAYELGMSLIWVFGDSSSGPRRLWDPWRAKQKGCFFTPRFIAEYMAQRALEADDDAILDPAAGAGALLLEAFLMLRGRYGPRRGLREASRSRTRQRILWL